MLKLNLKKLERSFSFKANAAVTLTYNDGSGSV